MKYAYLWSLSAMMLLTSCASAGGEDLFREGPTDGSTIQVTVENQAFNDATLWALWEGGARERMGIVTGLSSRTFSLEPNGELVRFEVDFLAGTGFVGNELAVFPGDHLELRLPPQR